MLPPSALQLHPPANWPDFEVFCLDLWRQIWADPGARRNGRSGQEQSGVDIFGRPEGGGWVGVQCKVKSQLQGRGLTAKEIQAEVDKARTFTPKLTRFVIATTALRDVEVQAAARTISENQRAAGSFPVDLAFWEDILEALDDFLEVAEKYFGYSPGPIAAAHSGVMVAPKRPPHYLERSEVLAEIKAALLGQGEQPVGISGQGRVGVQGMGGIGKTVLAAAVLDDPDVQAAFPDGIHWITVSQTPDLLRLLQDLAFALGDSELSFETIHRGKLRLSRLLAGQRVLVVLDDVWTLDHANHLDVVGSEGRLLITTRNRQVLNGLGAEEIRLDVLPEPHALEFLASWAGQGVEDLPPEAEEVVGECGRLPLALAMIGARVALGPTAWGVALERLKRADLDRLERAFPEYPYPDLLKALGVSVEFLEDGERERYLKLAVFPEDTAIPRETILTLWEGSGLDRLDGEELLVRLEALSLVQAATKDRVTLHDLQVDYLRHQTQDLPALHRRLVEAYETKCPGGFATGPDDGYFFQQLPHHLVEGELLDSLREIVFDFAWLRTSLQTNGIRALLSDFARLSEDEEVQLVERVFHRAFRILDRDAEQLAGQLWGHLSSTRGPGIEKLLGTTSGAQSAPWFRPTRPTFDATTSASPRVLDAHSGSIVGWALLRDCRVVSASFDKTLRVWDMKSGAARQTLQGHTGWVRGVAVLGDGRLVSASADRTLRVWDVASGQVLQTLEGHTHWVNGVAVLEDGRVISASEDKTLRVWDAESGTTLRTLEGHRAGVNGVAVLADGRVISASDDHSLRVWDVETGQSLQTLKGHLRHHSFGVWALAVLRDGRVVSASGDHTLRVWDVESGTTLQTLEGHVFGVCGVAVLDGTRLISAGGKTLRLWDLESGACEARLVLDRSPNSLVVLPDHRTIVAGDSRGRVHFLKLEGLDGE